jgi:hypothetical protein
MQNAQLKFIEKYVVEHDYFHFEVPVKLIS